MILAIFSLFTALAFAQGPCADQTPIAGSDGWWTCGGLTGTYRYECHADGTPTDDGQYCCCNRHFQPDGSGNCQECPKEVHNSCVWVGEAPYCNADSTSCPSGYTYVLQAQTQINANEVVCPEMGGFVSHLQRPMHPTCPGFGSACDGTLFGTITGLKVYCCNLPDNYWDCQDDFAGARVAANLHGFPNLKSCLNVDRAGQCRTSQYEADTRRYCPRTCGFCGN